MYYKTKLTLYLVDITLQRFYWTFDNVITAPYKSKVLADNGN
jgi:hypothetical protein